MQQPVLVMEPDAAAEAVVRIRDPVTVPAATGLPLLVSDVAEVPYVLLLRGKELRP